MRLALAPVLLCLACGRTNLFDSAVVDSGARDSERPDAGVAQLDAGAPEARCPPVTPGSGRVWGSTPLGAIDFNHVWVGTEGPWSHSCPHVTVLASPSVAPDARAQLSVDFLFQKPPVLGPTSGLATLVINGKTATFNVGANVTRADGLTMSSTSSALWRTTLTFAADGGWTLQGFVTEVPDCARATWFCL